MNYTSNIVLDLYLTCNVTWIRVACDYKNKNLSIRVEERSKNPGYLAIKILYQGGQTEIVAVDIAKVNKSLTLLFILTEKYLLLSLIVVASQTHF